jgi:hypothetical protein
MRMQVNDVTSVMQSITENSPGCKSDNTTYPATAW